MKDTIHGIILTITWIGFANIGVIAMAFKYSRATFYIHAICMWMTAIGGFAGSVIKLVPKGFHIKPDEKL